MQILLIDDNDIDNAVNAKLLQLAKISEDITTFTDPMKALRHLATVGSTWTSPRHILLDIRMPNFGMGLNGLTHSASCPTTSRPCAGSSC